MSNNAGQAVSVTGARYNDKITQYILDGMDMAIVWFQQDGVFYLIPI